MKAFYRSLIGLSLLCLVSSSAFAADSAANRKDKKFWIGIQPTGLHIPTIVAPPLQLGYSVSDDLVVGMDIGSGSYSDTVEGSDTSLTYRNLGGWGRWYMGSSFYLKGGLHQRSWDATGTYTETNYSSYGTYTAKANLKATALVGSVGLGNIWTFDAGFYIGADWVVAETLLSESHSYSVTSNTGISTSTVESEFDSLGKAANKLSAAGGLAILTLGWTF